MSMLDFKKRFNQDIDINEVQKNFVNQVNHYLIEQLDEKIGHYYFNGDNPLFDAICLGLNKNPASVIANFNSMNYGASASIPPLRNLTGDDFEKTLVVVELAYEYFSTHGDYARDEWIQRIDATPLEIQYLAKQLHESSRYWRR